MSAFSPLADTDRLATLYKFEPPRDKGMNTVQTCEGILKGSQFHGKRAYLLPCLGRIERDKQASAGR